MARLIQGHDDEWVLRDEWGIEDIRTVLEDFKHLNTEVTDEDCINVMKIAETSFDANIGLNWDSIASAISFYFACKEEGVPMFYRGQPIKATA